MDGFGAQAPNLHPLFGKRNATQFRDALSIVQPQDRKLDRQGRFMKIEGPMEHRPELVSPRYLDLESDNGVVSKFDQDRFNHPFWSDPETEAVNRRQRSPREKV